MFYYKGTSTGRISGIEFLIKKEWKDRVVNVTGILDRVASLTLQLSEKYYLQVVQTYASTTSHSKRK